MNLCALQTSLKILFLQDSSVHCINGQSPSFSGILAKNNTRSSRPGMGVAGYQELPRNNTSEAICILLRQQSTPSHVTDSSCKQWTALAFLYSGIHKYSRYSHFCWDGCLQTQEWHHHMLDSFPQLLAPKNGTIYSRDIDQIIATTVGQDNF